MHTAENVSHRNLLSNASAEQYFVLNSRGQCLHLCRKGVSNLESARAMGYFHSVSS